MPRRRKEIRNLTFSNENRRKKKTRYKKVKRIKLRRKKVLRSFQRKSTRRKILREILSHLFQTTFKILSKT